MSGYDVCRAIRADPAHAMLPVVLVTALDPAAGARQGPRRRRRRLPQQAGQPGRAAGARALAAAHQVALRRAAAPARRARRAEPHARAARRRRRARSSRRVGRLKRFFSPQLAELIVAGGADDPLKSHRREITVVFLDLRGFTAFTETAEPEEVMARAAANTTPRWARSSSSTKARSSASPATASWSSSTTRCRCPIRRRARCAWRSRCSARSAASPAAGRGAATSWRMGVGIAQGFATIGGIGFPGPHRLRRDRHRHQPGGAPVRRGARRRDPGVAARPGPARRRAGVRARGRARPEGIPPPGAGVSRSRRGRAARGRCDLTVAHRRHQSCRCRASNS